MNNINLIVAFIKRTKTEKMKIPIPLKNSDKEKKNAIVFIIDYK
jgi:hypothetical protein